MGNSPALTSLCLVAGPQSSISSRSPSLSTGSCRSGWAWAFQRTACIFRPFSVFTITEVVCLLRGWSQAYHPVGGGNQALGSSAGQSRLDFSSSAGWGGGAGIAGLQGLFFYESTHFRSFPPLFCHSGNSQLAADSKQARREVRRVLSANRYIHRTYVI